MAAWRRLCQLRRGGVSFSTAPGAAPTPDPSAPALRRASHRQCCRLRAMDAPGAPAPTVAPGPGPGRKELKIVIVGDGGCGKTSLLMVYSQGSFPEVRPAGGMEAGRLGGGDLLGATGGEGWPSACATSPDPGSPASCAWRGGRHPGALPREFQSPAG